MVKHTQTIVFDHFVGLALKGLVRWLNYVYRVRNQWKKLNFTHKCTKKQYGDWQNTSFSWRTIIYMVFRASFIRSYNKILSNFSPIFHFFIPWKRPKTNFFWGYRNESLAYNGLTLKVPTPQNGQTYSKICRREPKICLTKTIKKSPWRNYCFTKE